jgi:hypothetical protein
MQAVIVEMSEVQCRKLHGSGSEAQLLCRLFVGPGSGAKVLPQCPQVGAGELRKGGFHGKNGALTRWIIRLNLPGDGSLEENND